MRASQGRPSVCPGSSTYLVSQPSSILGSVQAAIPTCVNLSSAHLRGAPARSIGACSEPSTKGSKSDRPRHPFPIAVHARIAMSMSFMNSFYYHRTTFLQLNTITFLLPLQPFPLWQAPERQCDRPLSSSFFFPIEMKI